MLRRLQSLSFLFLLLVIPVVCQQTPSAPAMSMIFISPRTQADESLSQMRRSFQASALRYVVMAERLRSLRSRGGRMRPPLPGSLKGEGHVGQITLVVRFRMKESAKQEFTANCRKPKQALGGTTRPRSFSISSTTAQSLPSFQFAIFLLPIETKAPRSLC